MDSTRLYLTICLLSTAICAAQSYNSSLSAQYETLSGNNLIFSDYLEQYAPQNAAYFVPAVLDGSYAEALESAIPTRNAISYTTATANLFLLSTRISTFIRSHQYLRGTGPTDLPTVASLASQKHIVAGLDAPEQNSDPYKVGNSTIWADVIGAFTYLREQNQTPAFHPSSGGFILAYNQRLNHNFRIGVGASYLYTYVDETEAAGHSFINQENLFFYATWSRNKFYLDGSLWGGLFQTHQVRNIAMAGFDFASTSNPTGVSCIPHIEWGYHETERNLLQNMDFSWNPFLILASANSWQGNYSETGDGPFNASQSSRYTSLFRTELGFRFFETFTFKTFNLVFEEKGAYVNVLPFTNGQLTATLIGSPGSFTVESFTGVQNLGVCQILVLLEPYDTRYPAASAFYQGEFGSKLFTNQINFGASWNF